jgi:hypothetical protein
MSVAALTMWALAGSAEAKARGTGVTHTAHSGTFVSAAGGKLVMTGRNGKEHSHPLAKPAAAPTKPATPVKPASTTRPGMPAKSAAK